METLFAFILTSHSWIRWILMAGSAGLGLASALASRQDQPWGGAYKKAAIFMAVLVTIQFVIGIALHLHGDFLKAMINSPATFFKNKELRFFGMEHPIATVLAVGLIHMGVAKARRAGEDEGARAHKLIAYTQLGALLLFLIGNPWFRPLFR